VVEGSQDECIDAASGGLHNSSPMEEGDGLAGSCANCDHKDGEEVCVGSTHGIGMEDDMGSGGLQI
jgi:hypothetical protein